MCGQTFTEKSGIIKTPTYPFYDTLSTCTATITTTVNVNLIKAYIIDMNFDQKFVFNSFNQPRELIHFLILVVIMTEFYFMIPLISHNQLIVDLKQQY